jgi:hypothetical protein
VKDVTTGALARTAGLCILSVHSGPGRGFRTLFMCVCNHLNMPMVKILRLRI